MGQNPTKNQQSLPFAERVNFGFGNLSKLPDENIVNMAAK